MATVPSGAMIRVVTTCALDMTACSMATGAPSRTARRSCTGTNRSLSPFRSPSMGERSRQMHKMIATTVSDNAVPNAAPVTPRSAPGSVNAPSCRVGKISRELNTTSSPHMSTSSMLGVRIFPPACSRPTASRFSCTKGSDSAKIRKYEDAPGQIELSAWSQWGSPLAMAPPTAAISSPKANPAHSPCFTRFRASFSSPAPMRCATMTENPTTNALHSPPNSHVLEATSPMAAEASRPSCPTMAASMYCMTIDEICAKIAGKLSCNVSAVCCRRASGRPSRNSRRRSCFAMCFLPLPRVCSPIIQTPPHRVKRDVSRAIQRFVWDFYFQAQFRPSDFFQLLCGISSE